MSRAEIAKLPEGHPLRRVLAAQTAAEASKPPPPARAALARAIDEAARKRAPIAAMVAAQQPPKPPPPKFGVDAPPRKPSKWSRATPTFCALGHKHPSKLEATVCARIHPEAAAAGLTVFRTARWPVLALGTDTLGHPYYVSPDFTLAREVGGRWQIVRAVDPKGRRSPEWRRGAAAFHATYGVRIEEVSK